MVYGWTAYKKDEIKYNLSMLNRKDIRQNLGNLRSWNLIGKENNYFVFENTPYIIYVDFDYLNSTYLTLLLYKNNKDNLITKITERNVVDHLKKWQLEIIYDFLNDLYFYYKNAKVNKKTTLARNLVNVLGLEVKVEKERVANIFKKLPDEDLEYLIEIFE